MPRGRSKADPTTLAMALVGYQIEKEKIEDKIREIRAHLGGRAVSVSATESATAGAAPARRKRVLSASARRRIAAAQRKRWAEHRKKMAKAGKGE